MVTIALALTIAVASVGILQYLLFRSEQFRLIDSRIESTATLLISSELSKSDLKDFEEAEQIISEVVGGEEFNQFIIVYKRTGAELYRSPLAEAFPAQIPKTEKWQTIETEAGHIIRVLTLPLEKGIKGSSEPRILQTGLILDQDLLRLRDLSRNVIVYSILILFLILILTYFLSEALLQPLTGLANYLRYLTSHLNAREKRANEPKLPSVLRGSKDEFGRLVLEVQRLRDHIGAGLRNTQVWTAQMAHEMKTPLTILQNNLESLRSEESALNRELRLKEASDEIAHLNSLISSFLEWSAAANLSEGSEDLHAVRLGQVANELAEKFIRQYPARVLIEGDSDLRVFAKRGFAQQAISNLLTNALRYSPESSVVRILVTANKIEIVDQGLGLPQTVSEHLGEPFNYGVGDRHGFGLGLAWVRTICSRYGWDLKIERLDLSEQFGDQLGDQIVTVASIEFPRDDQ